MMINGRTVDFHDNLDLTVSTQLMRPVELSVLLYFPSRIVTLLEVLIKKNDEIILNNFVTYLHHNPAQ